jgi:trafficking protein particle complex subunit 9
VIFGDADFIGPVGSPVPPMSSLTPHHHNDGPSSLSGVNSLVSGMGNSFPSRVNSPVHRRNNEQSSFRSSSTAASGTVNSGHSSLATFSLGAMNGGNQTRTLEALLKFRYSGETALSDGLCRECSLGVTLELLPSVQITSWDVLPAEV